MTAATTNPVLIYPESEFLTDNLLVRIHRCFWWTGLVIYPCIVPCSMQSVQIL